MKIPVALLSMAISIGVASCGPNATAPQTSDNNSMKPDGATGTAVVAPRPAGSSAMSPTGTQLEGDAPPKDAQFTIFCDAIRGPNHVMTSTAIKDHLSTETGLHNWHILHSNDQSAIFYGYYATFNDKEHFPAETARAQADLHKLESLKNTAGDRMFAKAIFLPINNPDPDAPPQWNLVNTPPTAYWSLQIAAFRGFPERKQAAVEAVRKARESGIEAYYFHGETISSVCIGAWPADAIKQQDMKGGGTADPNETVMVVPQPLPPGVIQNMRDREGNHVTIEAPKLEVLDGTLAKAIRDYPDHAVNYEVTVQTAKTGEQIRSPSFLVVIPHSEGPPAPMIPLPQPTITANNGADQAASDILDNTKPNPGHLRSINQP